MPRFTIRHLLLATVAVAVLIGWGPLVLPWISPSLPNAMMLVGLALAIYFAVNAKQMHGQWLGLFYSLLLLMIGFVVALVTHSIP